MAKTVEELAEILNNLNEEYKNNTEEFDKVLKNIVDKLDAMLEDQEEYDSVKIYVSELKEAIEVKNDYATTLLDNIESLITRVLDNQEAGAKTSQIRDLFQILNANIELFSSKISAQGDLIAQIEEDINILKPSESTRQELVDNINEVKEQVAGINAQIYSSFDTVNDNINSAVKLLESVDITSQNEFVKQNLVVIKDSYASVLDVLKLQDEKIAGLFEKLEGISTKEDLDKMSSKIDEIGAFFVASNNANNQKIDEGFDNIENEFAGITEQISAKNDEIVSFLQESDEHKLENLRMVAESIKSLQEVLDSANIEYKALLEERIVGLKSYVSDIGDSLYSSYTEGNSLLSDKLSSLDELSHGFETSLINVNVNLQNILKNLMAMDPTEQNDIIKRELENIYMSANAILASLKIADQKNDEIVAMFSNIASCDDLNKIQETLDNITVRVHDIFSGINSLSSKDDIAQIDAKISDCSKVIEELKNAVLASVSENNSVIEEQLNKLEKSLKASMSENSFVEFKKDLADFIQKILDNSAALHINTEDTKLKIADIYLKLKEQDCSADVKGVLENVIALKQCFEGNSQNIISEVKQVSQDVSEMKDEFVKLGLANNAKVSENIEVISSKLDNIQDNLALEVANTFSDMKDMFSNLAGEISSIQSEHSEYVKDSYSTQVQKLAQVAEDVQQIGDSVRQFSDSEKQNLEEALANLKDYITELDVAAKDSSDLTNAKFVEKLVHIEELISQNVDSYETNWAVLQSKLNEYAQRVDKVNEDTEAKLSNSIEEVNSIRVELSALSELITRNFNDEDGKFDNVVALLDAGVKSVSDSISEINSDLKNKIGDAIKEDLVSLDDKFENILSLVDVLKSDADSSRQNFISDLEDKFSLLKQELDLANTDIVNVLNEKFELITADFSEIKTNIEDVLNSDSLKALGGFKEALEMSYMNISADLLKAFGENQESISQLENVYKEVSNKISEIEDCLKVDTQENLELVKLAVETVQKNVKDEFEDWNSAISQLNAKIDEIAEKSENSLSMLKEEIQNNIDSKLDEYIEDLKAHIGIALNAQDTMTAIDELKHDLSEKFASLLIDFALGKEKVESVEANIEDLKNSLKSCIKDDSEKLLQRFDLTNELVKKTDDSLEALHSKMDLLVLSSENDGELYSDAFEGLNEKIDNITVAEGKLEETLMALHQKVDTLALFNDSEDFDAQEEIEDIKNLIISQRKYFESSGLNERTEAISSCLEDLLTKIQNIENGLSDVDLEKNTQDIKESIMAAIVSVFEQVSFVEETEEIKDFVEEKTDEITNHLKEVREQLKQITSANSDGFDYSYTLQDVESDIAKLRIALNEISNSTSKDDINDLSLNINRIAHSVEGLQSSLTPDQMLELKEDIEKLNEDIISISSRTNKLLLTSDEAYRSLSSGLDRFSNVVSDLEEKISYIDYTEVNERFEKKIDSIKSMLVTSANTDKVFHQVLTYLGEWIDSTSENITSITENTSEINKVKDMIEDLRVSIPDKASILDELEERFEMQESRIDRLEMKIEKIISTLEEKDDMMLNNKVDKIERQLSRLSANIEKLASYVDEE